MSRKENKKRNDLLCKIYLAGIGERKLAKLFLISHQRVDQILRHRKIEIRKTNRLSNNKSI
jgi:hypothetical protein